MQQFLLIKWPDNCAVSPWLSCQAVTVKFEDYLFLLALYRKKIIPLGIQVFTWFCLIVPECTSFGTIWQDWVVIWILKKLMRYSWSKLRCFKCLFCKNQDNVRPNKILLHCLRNFTPQNSPKQPKYHKIQSLWCTNVSVFTRLHLESV